MFVIDDCLKKCVTSTSLKPGDVMKKLLIALMILSASTVFAGTKQKIPINNQRSTTVDLPVVSANGFTCKKTTNVVSCKGTFPSFPDISFQAKGNEAVTMEAYDSRSMVNSYESATGCLCKYTINESSPQKSKSECISKSGKMKKFNVLDATMARLKWCLKD